MPAEYQTTEGFALVTDVVDQYLEDLRSEKVPKLPTLCGLEVQEGDSPPGDVPVFSSKPIEPSATALYAVCRSLSQPLRETSRFDKRRQHFKSRYGVDAQEDELARRYFKYREGFDDLDFTWNFAPAVAKTMVDRFVEVGRMTSGQREAMTLHDWANIIGSGWFSGAIHSMAFTNFGVYGNFGIKEAHFAKGSLLQRLGESVLLKDLEIDLFSVQTAYETAAAAIYGISEDRVYLTAEPTPEFVHVLRNVQHDPPEKFTNIIYEMTPESPGCPVARYATRVDDELVQTDRHIRSMLERGRIAITPSCREGRSRLIQNYTVIDIALEVLAGKLDIYQREYGMPRLQPFADTREVTHEPAQPLHNVLSWPAAALDTAIAKQGT